MRTGYLRSVSLYPALFILAVSFSVTGGLAEGGIVIRSSGGKIVTNKSSDTEKQQKKKAKPAAKPAKPSESSAEPEKIKKETAKPATAAKPKKKHMTGLILKRGKGGVILSLSSAEVSRPAAVKSKEKAPGVVKAEPEAAKKVELSFLTPGLEKLAGTWEIVEESDGKLILVRPEVKQAAPEQAEPEKAAGKTETAEKKPEEPAVKVSGKKAGAAGLVIKVADGKITLKGEEKKPEVMAAVKSEPEKVEPKKEEPKVVEAKPAPVKIEKAVPPPEKPKRKPAIVSAKKAEPKPKTVLVGKKRQPPVKTLAAAAAGAATVASKKVAKSATTVVASAKITTSPSPQKAGGPGKWKIQLGSKEWDESSGIVAASGGRTYITGNTRGNFDGKKNRGGSDVFVVFYDSSGRKKWTKLIGTPGEDRVLGITVDQKGNLFITGSTDGSLDGNENAGGADAFISKISPNGKSIWTRTLGTAGSEEGTSIAVDSGGNAYITGLTSGSLDENINAGSLDVFIAKYSRDGKKLWTSQLGTTETDMGQDVAVDKAGNVYITGSAEGSLDENQNQGGSDLFVAKYDSSGGKQWTKLIGSPADDYGTAVVVGSGGNVYLTGSTNGDLAGNKNAGGTDSLIAGFDTGGNRLWVTLFGTATDDSGNGIALDPSGNIYITGSTMGKMGKEVNSGGSDIFYAKFDKKGSARWAKLIGSTKDDYGKGLVVGKGSNILITGSTYGDFGGANAGSSDAFLVKVPK